MTAQNVCADIEIRMANNGFVVFVKSKPSEMLVFHGMHELVPWLCEHYHYDLRTVAEHLDDVFAVVGEGD